MINKQLNLLKEAVVAVQYLFRRKMKRKRRINSTTRLSENLILKVVVMRRKMMKNIKRHLQDRPHNSNKLSLRILLEDHCHSIIKVSINSRILVSFTLKHWDWDYLSFSHNLEGLQQSICRIRWNPLSNSLWLRELQSKLNMKKWITS